MSNTVEFYLNFIYNLIFAIYRDLRGAANLIFLKKTIKKFENENSTVSDKFRQLVKKHPNKACIVFNDEKWTFQDVKFCLSMRLSRFYF